MGMFDAATLTNSPPSYVQKSSSEAIGGRIGDTSLYSPFRSGSFSVGGTNPVTSIILISGVLLTGIYLLKKWGKK